MLLGSAVIVAAVLAIVLGPGHPSRGSAAGPTTPATPSPSASAPSRSAAAPSVAPSPGHSSLPPRPSPSATAVLAPRPPADKPGPVIVVPGYGGDRAMLDPLAAALRKAGRTTIILSLPDNAMGDLRGQAQVLGATVATQLKKGAASVDLVGYSAGGIVVALYAQADPSHVRRAVTIGSPLHGTRVAGLAAGLVPSACPTACEQMVPGSPLLASLSDAAPARTGVPWLSMWTSHDEVVVPATSAQFDGARNVELQSVCPDDAAGHTTLPADPLAIGLTISALGSWPIPFPAPAASDCDSLRLLSAS